MGAKIGPYCTLSFAVDTDNIEQVQSDVKPNFVTPQTDNKLYITRSGRVVKPKIIQSM